VIINEQRLIFSLFWFIFQFVSFSAFTQINKKAENKQQTEKLDKFNADQFDFQLSTNVSQNGQCRGRSNVYSAW
jgi:hypothetical protein